MDKPFHMRKIILLCMACIPFLTAFAQRTLLIRDVHVVDVEKGTLLKNAQVLIKDSVITQIITRKQNIKADTVIEGGNRYLIPGLWDMHTHIWDDQQFFPLLIANGVTGVRDMFEYNIAVVRNWSKEITAGKKIGPTLIAAGPIVDGEKPMWPFSVSVKNAAEGRRAVDSLKNRLHTDFVKVYSSLSRDAYFAIAEEARKQQFPFAGHVPHQITILEAAQAGQKSMEHLYGFVEAASDSAHYYAQIIQKNSTDTLLKTATQRRSFLLRTFNLQKLKQTLQEMKKHDTWICPTMTVNRGIAYMNDSNLLKDPRLQYLSPFVTAAWNPVTDFRFKSWTAETFAWYRQEFDLKMKILKAIYETGIPILAGTDFPNPYCLPGFSLHDELQWMVKAGIPAVAALQTATINPARYLGKQATYGSVAVNKIADLVLLDQNPLTDISNTTKINAVFVHGKLLNQTAIRQMLENVKKASGH
jgi:hypothetical protein